MNDIKTLIVDDNAKALADMVKTLRNNPRLYRKVQKAVEKIQERSRSKPVKLPASTSDFEEIITENYYYVDKTELIKEIWDAGGVSLITRPRRFGKTINMKMLKCFFEKREGDDGTKRKRLFKGLEINEYPEYMVHQGEYPVVFMTFKDIREPDWATCYQNIRNCIIKAYREHKYLLDSLDSFDHEDFMEIMKKEADEVTYHAAIGRLMEYLSAYHKQKVMVLIDEYDTPINYAYEKGYYDEAIHFFRNMLSSALKDNNHLKRGVLTGCLRISQESTFTGLNNLTIFSLKDSKIADKFGFTEDEVISALRHYGLEKHEDTLRQWYNGYNIGGQTIYNPFSIINFLYHGKTGHYWLNTSSNSHIAELFARKTHSIQKNVELLLEGKSVEMNMEEGIVYQDFSRRTDLLWTLLFFSGYLTFVSASNNGKTLVKIPNREVRHCFKTNTERWLNDAVGSERLTAMLKALTLGNIKIFQEHLQHFVINMMSYYDTGGQEAEKVYHAFCLGLLVNLDDTYEITSNIEAGHGRYDLMMMPKNSNKIGFVMEFKKSEKESALEADVNEAIEQIKTNEYCTTLQRKGISRKMGIGVAFTKKRVKAKGVDIP